MKKIIIIWSILFCCSVSAQSETRKIIPFDDGWQFYLGDAVNAHETSFNDGLWRTLNVPHDWSIEGENLQDAPGGGNVGYFPMGVGWYRKTFSAPALAKDTKWSIEFDGVYENSDVWINGVHLGRRPFGYSSFSYDLTPHLRPEKNVIAVRVDNSNQPNSRWYSGSGVYRRVRLVGTKLLHVDKWGVFAYTPKVDSENATVAVETTINNSNVSSYTNAIVKQTLRDAGGTQVATAEAPVVIAANSIMNVKQLMTVSNPKLWDIDSPNLYTLETTVLAGRVETDFVTTTIGIRHIEYDREKGFILNGRQVKMKGVNLHHDTGGVGAAVPERMWERKLQILKDGGCNAVRTAHNIMAPEFYEICDRLGMLVMDEVFDEWERGKRDYSYHRYFNDWHEKDLISMVRRNRNHPSIVMWSIGNEVPDQSSPRGAMLARTLINITKREDPTRLVTAGNDNIASDNNYATDEYLYEFRDEIQGYNYADRWRNRRELIYSIDKAANPTWRFLGTETGGLGGPRCSYLIGNDPNKVEARYGPRIDTEQRWKFTLLYDYVIGDFMWTGIDYYGESRWPSRGATSGMIDNCGFPKDGYYFFKSIWVSEPVLHVFPHWNWEGREGQIFPVYVYSNCDTVELFVNGKSYGQKRFEFPRKGTSGGWNSFPPGKVQTSTANLHLSWDVAYEPGELKAVGRKDGKQYTTQVFTTGKPEAIRLSVDRSAIKAHSSDVAHVRVEIVDSNGRVVPYADNLVKFELTGAKLIGVENGNMMDLSSTKISERKAFNGLCLAIVQAESPGNIIVKAVSEHLKSAEIEITATKP